MDSRVPRPNEYSLIAPFIPSPITLARKLLSSSQLAPDIVSIEPRGRNPWLVTTEALTQRKFHVAFEPRPGRGKMVFTGSLSRSQHGCPRARHPYPLIGEQCPIEVVCVACDRGREHAGVLDRHGRAPGKRRQHGVSGVANARDPPFA